MLVTVGQPCFVPSPHLVRVLLWTYRATRHKRCLLRRHARQRVLIIKSRTIILFTNTTLNRLCFGEHSTRHFHFRSDETEDMFEYQSNPVGFELFSYVKTFDGFGFMLSRVPSHTIQQISEMSRNVWQITLFSTCRSCHCIHSALPRKYFSLFYAKWLQ